MAQLGAGCVLLFQFPPEMTENRALELEAGSTSSGVPVTRFPSA